MDTLISTLIFLIPGFLAYFWLQAFGMNPVTKHSTTEFSTVSILLWLPVSALSVYIFNFLVRRQIINAYQVHSLNALKQISQDFDFILVFLTISCIVSFVFSAIWSTVLHKWVDTLINLVRKLRNLAPLSPTTTVWEEFFIRIDAEDQSDEQTDQDLSRSKKKKKNRLWQKREKIMVLLISKIDKPDEFEIGSMRKASRPYEADRGIVLEDTNEWRERLEYYEFPVKRVFFDLKSGLKIKELDYENPTLKENKDDK